MDESSGTSVASELAVRILESLGEGVVAFDSRGFALGANVRMAGLMGWGLRTVAGTHADLLLSAHREVARVVSDALTATAYVQDHDISHLGEGANARHIRVSTAPLPEPEGNGTILVARDVSHLKRMEREIFQAEKMSALGRLAASVAHEVRNPLGAINIQLDLLAEDLDSSGDSVRDRMARRIAIATSEITRMDRIVGNFLRFSRPPRLRLERVSLNDVVRRVFELVRPEAREKEIALEEDLAPDLPTIDGDEGQLAQALLNMTVNAFHAIPCSGTVRAESSAAPTEGKVRLRLSDTGCGIDAEGLDRIFELYFTTKDEGTGLGLSIAQRIVYDHGGSVDVTSVAGEGTVFEMIFPVAGTSPTLSGREGKHAG